MWQKGFHDISFLLMGENYYISSSSTTTSNPPASGGIMPERADAIFQRFTGMCLLTGPMVESASSATEEECGPDDTEGRVMVCS